MLTNKHKICIAFICIGFAMAGCKKDLLNTLPNDRLSTEVFWKTENDARLAVNAAYPFLDDVNIFTWDALTDIAHTNQFFTNDATVEKGIYDATNSKMATEWSNAYRGIAAANFVLDNIDKIKTANAAIINQYKGEARTLRAYQYIKLASLFGGVPLVTKTINIEEGKGLARATVGQVWDFVDKELKESADLLPATHVAVDKGRITKGAALA
ncbi:MAG TPA: RagB/SusD family nutrient uptake outer membrane protein, partial [Flavisolibacter sp.]|nr:RagB/SusD family nutrient uptake outer membrane protein [Flavisolibacter sp.]